MSEKKQSSAIGIDLGTTYSCVAGFVGGELTVFPNQDGLRTTPSIVAFEKEGRRLIGSAAAYKRTANPKSVVYDAKRLIGREFDDKTVEKFRKNWSFELVRWDKENNKETNIPSAQQGADNIRIAVPEDNNNKKYYDPVEISSYILTYLAAAAKDKLRTDVKSIVVTVPAHFNDNQREKTKLAAEIAGFTQVRLLNEPTAAAMAYGYGRAKDDKGRKDGETVLVFDLGGGTFDVSILKFEPPTEEGSIAEVLKTDGDTALGGADFDNSLFDHCIATFLKQNPPIKETQISDKAKRRLRNACENAKRTLTTATITNIELDYFVGEESFSIDVSRGMFENICGSYFKRCMEKVKGCLLELGGGKADYMNDGSVKISSSDNNLINKARDMIDNVVVVGGSSRIPKVLELLEEFFGKQKINHSLHPDEAIALGAAYQAALLEGDTDLDDRGNILLLDATPLTISIETAGGIATPMIPKCSTIPTSKTQVFTTYSDNQPSVTISICEGERSSFGDNNLLGRFNLDGIPPAPRGVPQIEVKCEIDNNGILKVTAKDLSTSNTQHLTVTNMRGRHSEEDVKRMVEEAKKHEEADKKHVEKVNSRNNLEQTIHSVKSVLEKGQLEQNVKEGILKDLKEHEDWLLMTPNAEKQEYDTRLKQVQDIMAKYIPQGGQPGGFPGQPQGGPTGPSADGPSVEEVD
ncbi:Hsp70 protein [Spraguea lophii 42_110]|uniref:Hsp70 protein n=1 Tax=Spraguea lophii (strain 42_110) TaxID=1358809 RepID=S7XVR1_SPRLO|nr:Hsp70 protein [Spraguea lophii 42_110]